MSHRICFHGQNYKNPIVNSAIFPSAILRIAALCRMLVLSLMLLPDIASAQTNQVEIGALFYSPAERTAIVAARTNGGSGDIGGEMEGGKKGEKNFGTSVAVSGLVKRGSGKGTAWINGKAVAEGQAVPSAGIPVISPKSVIFDGQPVRVRETLDLESGLRTDALPPGAVSVKPSK